MAESRYPFYIYLHINGSLIEKSCFVVESDSEYFNSPFVVESWKINNYEDYQKAVKCQREYKERKGIT